MLRVVLAPSAAAGEQPRVNRRTGVRFGSATTSRSTRIAGVAAALVAAAGWAVLGFFNPFAPVGSTTKAIPSLMLWAHGIAAIVAVVGYPVPMFVAFVVTLPSLYLLLSPAFWWAGVATLAYLGVAMIAWSERRGAKTA